MYNDQFIVGEVYEHTSGDSDIVIVLESFNSNFDRTVNSFEVSSIFFRSRFDLLLL